MKMKTKKEAASRTSTKSLLYSRIFYKIEFRLYSQLP